jgi:peptidoglycan/LPS O-acetylase OafA/YrhL
LTAALLLVMVTSFPQIGGSIHTVWQLAAVALACSAGLLWTLYSGASRFLLGNPVMRWAGKLSYGFYMFHIVGLATGWDWYLATAPSGTLKFALQVLFSMAIGLAITILISVVSYYGWERWFLILKDRFAVVPSRKA